MPTALHARHRVRQYGPLRSCRAQPQGQLSFLEARAEAHPCPMPRPARRAARAHRPHLRGRTRPTGLQLVLPLASPPGGRRYVGVEAIATEEALRAARRGEAAGVAALVALTRPEVAEVARKRWAPGCALSVEELVAVAEARLVELAAWERFVPGRERGRTLWPKYARRLASQAMGDALTGEGLVRVTRWARRQRKARAAAGTTQQRVEYRGLDTRGRMVRRVAQRPVEAEEPALVGAAVELPEGLEVDTERAEQLHMQAEAVAALSRLPVRQRVAVAGPLGLLREGPLSERQLAQQLRCTVEEVAWLRTEGLQALREWLGAPCPS